MAREQRRGQTVQVDRAPDRDLPRRRRNRLVALIVAFASYFLGAASAAAQFLTTPIPLSTSIPDVSSFLAKNTLAPATPFVTEENGYVGVPAGTWTIYPMVGSELRYDDNILNTHIGQIADLSSTLSPTFVATRNHGIQNTLIYGALDIKTYLHTPKADYTNGRFGFVHTWEARRDLVFNVTGDLLRSTDVSNGGSVFGASPFFAIQSTTARGSLSMLKAAGPWFFDTSASLSNTSYGNTSFVNGQPLYQNYRDYSQSTITQRVGYSLNSNAYVFEDTVLDWQNPYLSPETRSFGVRETAGVGALQFGTLSGELFGGYQQRAYVSEQIGSIADPVLGAKLTWQPRVYLTFGATADETLQTASMISPATPTASALKVTDLTLSSTYALSQNWQAGLILKFEKDIYTANPQQNQIFSAALNWQYIVSRAFLLTATLQTNRIFSSVAASGYVADIGSIGLTYRY